MKKIFFGLILIFNFLPISQHCLGQGQTLTTEVKKQTITDSSGMIPDR